MKELSRKELNKRKRIEKNIKEAEVLFKHVIPEQLSERQREYYDMRLQGMYNAEIGREMGITRQGADGLYQQIRKKAKKNKAIFDAMLEMKE